MGEECLTEMCDESGIWRWISRIIEWYFDRESINACSRHGVQMLSRNWGLSRDRWQTSPVVFDCYDHLLETRHNCRRSEIAEVRYSATNVSGVNQWGKRCMIMRPKTLADVTRFYGSSRLLTSTYPCLAAEVLLAV